MNAQSHNPVLVHVGFPKALSSWLQKRFFIEQYGFATIMEPISAQFLLVEPTPFNFSPKPCIEYIDNALKEVAQGLVPVITSETLAGNMYCGGFDGKTCIDRVASVVPNARVLLVVREQHSLIRSLYKSLVTWGMPHSIERLLEPVTPQLAPQFNLDFLRFDQRVAYYYQLFGRDRVKVLPYEAFAESPEAFLKAIADFAGLHSSFYEPLSSVSINSRVNTGETLANLYMRRFYNYFFLSSPFNYSGLRAPTAEFWQRRIRRSKRNPLPGFMDNWFETGFAHKVSQMVQGEFNQSNQRLQELTGLDLAKYGYAI